MRFLLIALVFLALSANGQQKFTINGYIKDIANGEAMIGATVYIQELNSGTATNEYGFYSITVPQGN